MQTIRTVINRMLDPGDTGVTLATLTRALQVLGLFNRRWSVVENSGFRLAASLA
jgi:hypothetical protein